MLQFWKKSKGDVEKTCCLTESTVSTSNLVINNYVNHNSNSISPQISQFSDEDFNVEEFEASRKKSQLARSFVEVINSEKAFGYFAQFLESKNASKYIMCWMDIDAFRSSANKVLKIEHDSLSVSTDCDSLTADTNSLCDYSSITIDSRNACSPSLSNGDTELKSFDEVSPKNRKSAPFTETALSLFKKYIAQEATENIKCPELMRNSIIEDICDSDKILLGNCFDKVQTYINEILEKDYFETFLASDYFCKYQIDILTSGQVALDDILCNETALFYFMEFLQQEGNCNLLEFWIAATNFQQHLKNQKDFFDPIEAQSDAVVLYDKFFSLQALCPLGFGDKIRFVIEQNICGENGLVIECFDLSLKMVEQVLEKKYLEAFLASQLFYKYLSELINTVQSEYVNMEKTLSDCSSERSFGANSAFLALEINSNSSMRSKDMNIDTRQLCDPDSLWKRKKSYRLSCGRVTALGKFETDLEPEPDKKEFNLKRVVKKFVNLDEDKKKEEMAWQVAEMIVKDITSVTLNQERPAHC